MAGFSNWHCTVCTSLVRGPKHPSAKTPGPTIDEMNGTGVCELFEKMDSLPILMRTGSRTPEHDVSTAMIRKQDAEKIGFFDLAAELRIQISQEICGCLQTLVPSEGDFDDASVPSDFAGLEAWTEYIDTFTCLKLLCRQSRAEFLPVWAEATRFRVQLPGPYWRKYFGWVSYIPKSGLITNEALANRTWIWFRDFLVWLNSLIPSLSTLVRRTESVCVIPKARGDYTEAFEYF